MEINIKDLTIKAKDLIKEAKTKNLIKDYTEAFKEDDEETHKKLEIPTYSKCLRCNRPLKTQKAKTRGYGDYCWSLLQKERKHKRTLFNNTFIKKDNL